jgi:hypothetical protein
MNIYYVVHTNNAKFQIYWRLLLLYAQAITTLPQYSTSKLPGKRTLLYKRNSWSVLSPDALLC